ncbi:MAG: transcription-repair coupling factor, partial [Bacteroidales bacterium]|nr:transcription-repair coupling factor [Bacteroidales bacterium]
SKQAQLIILNDKEEAAYFYNDLKNISGDKWIYFFPASYKRSIKYQQPDSSNIVLRTEVLNLLAGKGKKFLIVTYPEALIEKVISRKELKANTLQLSEEENISMPFLEEVLEEYNFERVDFVYEPGQYSIRGSIVDVFSFSNDHPYRIDFFGDDVESIRTFDVETQLSLEAIKKISILPNIKDLTEEKQSYSFLKLLDSSFLIWVNDIDFITHRINELYNQTNFRTDDEGETISSNAMSKDTWIVTGDVIKQDIYNFTTLEFGKTGFEKEASIVKFNTSPQPVFNKNFELLSEDLHKNNSLAYKNYLLTENDKQAERLQSIFSDNKNEVEFSPVNITLHEGFIDHDLKLCCYTDHQIFERYHKFQLKTNFSKKEAISLKELTGLHPGDYVVHIDHGIGRFGGLEKIEVNGKMQETIKLVYKDNDTVYLSIHALHRISKYKGKEAVPPKIHKLGSVAWKNLKQKAKKQVKDIARDLIKLYAKRKSEKGFSFTPDTYMQDELEASFIYEDTPDQNNATKLTKESMEASFPMDLLVCGDVGFGKTEVAIRAAFKAAADSKQVAILVPTTILALQHFHTFSARLKDFPCTVDYINRFKTTSQQKKTLANLASGQTDIIIGTHRLAGKDVKFKDLGLLIIDEEQKFGVSMKEKIRQLKINIDTLTLTATPIPRTLQFSLMGARDLSIIRTPPPNRHPIITELHSFNEQIIREGIEYEISRGGQVFFIHNRVDNIMDIKNLIDKSLPKIKSVVAHGQMKGNKLEAIMMDFINGFYDVLIATTIIESGLDIPNANTIFINNAQNFGLSDLHQLRGRVGRSNKRAFCYLMAPPLQLLTSEARRRLKAIEEFSELGSGFNIAMQDLDIRGAGDLLGAQQSGFISEMGYETYQRILQEAVQELREEEFTNSSQNTETDDIRNSDTEEYVSDVSIDTDLELLFPDDYIYSISERIRLYRRLDNLKSDEEVEKYRKELADRFGELPVQTQELLNIVKLRKLARELGFEKIILKREGLILNFISSQDSPYFRSSVFSNILSVIQKKPAKYAMKERNKKLMLSLV